MRSTFASLALLIVYSVGSHAADPVPQWEEKPYLARRPNQTVPPPQFYATTAEIPAGAEVKIKVVKCPDKAGIELHDFLGGPVFTRGLVKEFSDLAADQVLTFKLDKKILIGIKTKIGDGAGTCKGLERKDGLNVMKFVADKDKELVLEVEVIGK